MAQILKEEVRNKIIEASKKELLEKGYENASLRKIALDSGVTVGNLYRYFDNKEDLINKICEPCLLKIEELIKEETNNQLSFFKESDGFSLDNEEMLKTIDQIIDKLIDIYKEYPDEFRILMFDSKLNASLLDWFSKLIYNLITGHLQVPKLFSKYIRIISRAYASSIIAGFKELLKNDLNVYVLKQMSIVYFRSYVNMLNSDINKIINGE